MTEADKIEAAIQTERARCAEIADAFADRCDVGAMETNDLVVVACRRAAERASNLIAAAIRASS